MEVFYNYIKSISAYIGPESTFLNKAVQAMVAISLAFILWFIFKRMVSVAEKKFDKFNLFKINGNLFKIIRKAGAYLLFLLTGSFLINLFHFNVIEKPYFAFFIILLATPVKDFLIITLKYLENNLADKTDTVLDDIIFDLLNKFSGAIVYSISVVLALDVLGINVMPFVAGAGIMGVAVGFAAKDTLSNLIAGILLIIDRPFEIGDRIEVWSAPAGTAKWGDVIDIGLRATKIKTTDNIVVIVPNNEIMKRDIVNYTIFTTKIRVRINIGISYDADIEKAKALIIKVADSADWILKDPAPKVVVRNFGESSVDLQLRVWIKNATKRMDTISFITDNVKSVFDAEKIEIPYPKREITIVNRSA